MLRLNRAGDALTRSRVERTPAVCTVGTQFTVSAARGPARLISYPADASVGSPERDGGTRRQSSMLHAAPLECLIVNNNWTHAMINEMERHRVASE
jgi:hypothetical protein